MIAKSSYSDLTVRRLFSSNITIAELTELVPFIAYDITVIAADSHGSPFKSTVLQVRTDEWGK